jgi:hypothetical protein
MMPNIQTLFSMFLVSFVVSLYAAANRHWNEMSISLFFLIASFLGILFMLLQ